MHKRGTRTILSMVLCILLALGALPAFAAQVESEKQEAPDGEKVVLTFANWGDGTEQKMFEDVFARYCAEHPNVEINYLFIPWGEYMTKLNTMAASGTMPDMGQMIEHSSLLWAENGMFADVSDLYESGAIAPRMPAVTFAETENGYLGSSFIQEVNVLFYDKDYTESRGVTVPTRVEDAWEWDDFVAAAQKLTVDQSGKHADEEGFDPANIDIYGVADVNPEIMAMSNGGGYFSPDGKEIWINKPESIEAIQRVADLMNVYHVSPIPTTRDAIGGGNNPLMTRKVAMHFAGQFCLLWYGEFIEKGELNLGTGVLPKMKELKTTNSGPAITVFKDSKHVDVAKDLLTYFYNTENILTNIHMGLWMPSEEAWYTDEALKSKWVDDSPIHPEEYKYGVIDMARDHVVPNAFYHLGITNELNAIINPALDQVWLGEKTAEDVILNEIMPQIQPIFDEYWAERQ